MEGANDRIARTQSHMHEPLHVKNACSSLFLRALSTPHVRDMHGYLHVRNAKLSLIWGIQLQHHVINPTTSSFIETIYRICRNPTNRI